MGFAVSRNLSKAFLESLQGRFLLLKLFLDLIDLKNRADILEALNARLDLIERHEILLHRLRHWKFVCVASEEVSNRLVIRDLADQLLCRRVREVCRVIHKCGEAAETMV